MKALDRKPLFQARSPKSYFNVRASFHQELRHVRAPTPHIHLQNLGQTFFLSNSEAVLTEVLSPWKIFQSIIYLLGIIYSTHVALSPTLTCARAFTKNCAMRARWETHSLPHPHLQKSGQTFFSQQQWSGAKRSLEPLKDFCALSFKPRASLWGHALGKRIHLYFKCIGERVLLV